MGRIKRFLTKPIRIFGSKPKKPVVLREDEELPLDEIKRLEIESRLEEEAEAAEDTSLPEGDMAKRRADLLFKQGKWEESNHEYAKAFNLYFGKEEYADALKIAGMQWELSGRADDRTALRIWGNNMMRVLARTEGMDRAIEFAADRAIGDYATNIARAASAIKNPGTSSKKKLDYVRYICSCTEDIKFYCGLVKDMNGMNKRRKK